MFDSSVGALAHRAIRALSVAAAAVLPLGAVGCASGAGAAREVVPDERSSRYVLLPLDIEKTKADNVYDVITKLRPEFLRGHGEPTSFVNQTIKAGANDPGAGQLPISAGTAVVQGPQPVVAYHDKQRLSSVEDLKLMTVTGIAEIRFIPGPQAGVKYGTNHSGGVILVTSK